MAGYSPMERAEAFIRAGELDEALQALNEQLETHPTDESARRLRISVLLRTAPTNPGVESALHTALADLHTLTTTQFEDILQRYQIQLRLGAPQAAYQVLLDAYAKADDIGRDPRLMDLLLEQLYQRGDPTTAINLLFDLPKTWRWLRWNGDFHALKGDYRVALDYYCSALDLLEESTQESPPSAVGFVGNLRGQILIRRAGMFEHLALFAEAEADLAEAESLIPGDSVIAFRRGLMAFLSGDAPRAAAICQAALAAAKPDSMRGELLALVQNDPRYASLAAVLEA